MRIHVRRQLRLSGLVSRTCTPPLSACALLLLQQRCYSSSGTQGKSTVEPSPSPPPPPPPPSLADFHLVSSYSLFAKRPARPFPPPFNSPSPSSVSGSSVEHTEGAHFLAGATNGDDAVLTNPHFLAVADGVGAWNTKSHGHAALWSRLMLHFWGAELTSGRYGYGRAPDQGPVDPVLCLEEAYKSTISATTNAGVRRDQVWQGTTTVCGALLLGDKLVVLNLGDSVGMVYRAGNKKDWVLRTKEQWHWFDCPRQLGTNSPDTPLGNAVLQEMTVQNGDLVVLATDGLVDNMWDQEIIAVIDGVLEESDEAVEKAADGEKGHLGRMKVLSQRIVEGAKKTAMNPFAESPYMERSIDEGLGIEGGKWDDISVVAAVCRSS
jgi:protein phosphatase PTC7